MDKGNLKRRNNFPEISATGWFLTRPINIKKAKRKLILIKNFRIVIKKMKWLFK